MHSRLLLACLAAGLLVACRGGEAADPPADPSPSLLDAIVAVQAAHDHVSGVYEYRNVRQDDPASGKDVWTGRFAFARPDRYRVRLAQAGDEGWEEYRSDGEHHWKIVSIDPDMEPVVTRVPIEEADQQWRRISRFILFDRETVEADFSLVAKPLAEGVAEALAPAARSEVLLTATTAAMKKYVQSVQVQFDADHRVVAVRIRDNSDNLMTAIVKEADYETPINERLFRWGAEP